MKTTFGNAGKNFQRLALVVALAALPVAVGVTGCSSRSGYHRSASEYTADRELTLAVERALENDTQFKLTEIEVTTLKGVVQLSGFVNTRDQKNRAGEVAKSVAGVKEVKNSITVKE